MENIHSLMEIFLDAMAVLAVGIAPLDIDGHAGQYNNSLGYHNNTGRVYTSWKVHANTLGLQYGKGKRRDCRTTMWHRDSFVRKYGWHLCDILR